MSYLLGEAVTFTGGPFLIAGSPVTPATLDLTITFEDGTITVFHVGDFTASGNLFSLDYLPPTPGFYQWRLVSTIPNTADEGDFTVAVPFAGGGGDSTFSDLVNDVATFLYGFGLERDKETSLTSVISDTTSTTFTVDDGTQVDRGVIEIDGEILAVKSADNGSGLVTVYPWGRGWNGTAAATHALGARVVNNPTFPRSRIKTTIQQIVNGLYPTLYKVAVDTTNTAQPARITYPVNAAALNIISISVQTIGPSLRWRPVTRYRFDSLADPTAFATGRSVDILEAMPPGRPIKIVYRSGFGTFTDDAQTLSDIGLDEAWRDVIALGAEARLLPALDNPRLELGRIEARNQTQNDQAGSATQVARQLFLQYQQRLHDEQDRLLRQYPASIVRMS